MTINFFWNFVIPHEEKFRSFNTWFEEVCPTSCPEIDELTWWIWCYKFGWRNLYMQVKWTRLRPHFGSSIDRCSLWRNWVPRSVRSCRQPKSPSNWWIRRCRRSCPTTSVFSLFENSSIIAFHFHLLLRFAQPLHPGLIVSSSNTSKSIFFYTYFILFLFNIIRYWKIFRS